jgi:phage shock protein C
VPENRLTRSETDKILAGVCGGIATYLGIDSLLVRLAFVVLLFASGIGFPIYLILWVIMPRQANVSKTGSQVIQENIGEMSDTVSSSMSRVGRPGTIGVLLILLGTYFLLNQLGWMHWANGIFWPLVIIGTGIYMMTRRR